MTNDRLTKQPGSFSRHSRSLVACSEEPRQIGCVCPGHVEATETRLAPEAGGRILTLTVKEGDRVQPGQVVMTLDTRDVQLAIQRARADDGCRRSATATRDRRRPRGRRAPGPVASRNRARGASRWRKPSSTAAAQDLAASNPCSPPTPVRKSSATMRRRDETWRGIASPPRKAASGPRKKRWPNCAPVPGPRKLIRPAPALPAPPHRWPRSRKDSPTPPSNRRSAASSPKSSSRPARSLRRGRRR